MKRWLGLSLVFILSTWSRIADAVITVTPTSPVNVGAVVIGTTGNINASLDSDVSGESVDVILTTTCTGAAGTFTLTGNTTSLNLNATKTFTVNYQPTARGLRECDVHVYDAGTIVNPRLIFKVRGTGVAPQVAVTPSPHDFTTVRVLDTAPVPANASRIFAISNASNDAGQTLAITGVTFSGMHFADFSVTTPGSTSLNPLASTNWTVTFNPSASGARTANMDIATNDPITPIRTVVLTGTGTNGVIAVGDVDFTTVNANTTASSTITVSNTAAAPVGPMTATFAIIDQTSTWFSFGTGSGCTAGQLMCNLVGVTAPTNKTVPVRCHPPAAASGTMMATVTFTSDSDSGGDSVASLSCTAGRPNISVSLTPLDFLTQVVGTTSTALPITIANTGNANLTFYFGANPAHFGLSAPGNCGTTSGTPCTVAAGTNMNLSVVFAPTSPGFKMATITINNNDPDVGDGIKLVDVSGTGIAGTATANPTSLAFASVEVGKASGNVLLTVTNTGTSNLTISNAGFWNGVAVVATHTEYSVATGTTATGVVGTQSTVLAPNDTATWNLNCHPTSLGAKPGTFRVVNNGYLTTPLDVGLSCNGLQGLLSVTGGTPTGNFYNFGPVNELTMPAPFRDFTLTNTGNISINNIMVAKDAKLLGFSILSPTFPINLAPGAPQVVRVEFYPTSGTDGCVYAAGTDCAFTFTGSWGTTPTNVSTNLFVVGDGLVAGYDTSPAAPNALDFGDVRFDSARTMTVSIINTAPAGGGTVNIQTLSIALGTSFSGEFAIMGCCRGAGCTVLTTCPTLAAPVQLTAGSTPLVAHVRFAPQNRVAMIDATLTVTSNLGGTPNRTVPLKGNSTTAGMNVTPSTNVLDFGPTDLDATPVAVTRRITIMNTGTASLNIGNGIPSGLGLARFVMTSTTGRIVAPNTTFDIDVTYTPLVEKPSNAPDVAQLMFPVSGVHGGPSALTIQLTGFGADRHIAVAPAPTFPDTFTNPEDRAPVLPVTVSNTGDAPLNISAVMLTNDPIWTVVNPDPALVPGKGTHDFNVRFAPQQAGKAPVGQLVIINNDNGMPMVQVDMNGNGIDRSIVWGPSEINLGYVGIGIPVRLSRLIQLKPQSSPLLSVASGDPTNTFTVTIVIEGGDDSFEIESPDGTPLTGLPLLPNAFHAFDVIFTPRAEGDFLATAKLYVDGASMAHSSVELKGRGLYAEVGGGGGCSTGRGTGVAMVLVVGMLLVGPGGRRRSARLHLRRRRRNVVLALLAVGTSASADNETRNVSLNLFDPTPAIVGTTFHLQSAGVGETGEYVATAFLSYANKSLVIGTAQNPVSPVTNRTTLSIGGAYAVAERYEAGARMPLYLQSGDAVGDPETMFVESPASGAARGDLTLHGKMQLGVSGALTFGAGAALTLPTASDGEFAGTELPAARAAFLASLAASRLVATVNLGGVVREKATYGNVNQGSGMVWGAGASYRLLDKMWIDGEVFGELIPGGFTKRPEPGQAMGDTKLLNTVEALAGVHFVVARTTSLGVAVGRGVNGGMGAPAIRGTLMFSYTPGATELKPLHPPRPRQPDKDADADGIKDELDACKTEAEDKDMFDDGDGCPEADNDNDGYPDGADKCPLDAEDKDRFQDEDGCPDKDNDGDGMADDKDKCPLAAEDKDTYQDQDGCPDPDNDGDGILDTKDKCPKEAETINGNADDDGCPDKGDALVVLSPDRVELLESIQFSGGTKIAKASINVLSQIGATLRAHPELVRIRLTAHVNPTGNAAKDQTLSEERAKAVREWLVDWGIEPLRLQISGFGGKKTLVPASQRGAQQINDRFELIILERK